MPTLNLRSVASANPELELRRGIRELPRFQAHSGVPADQALRKAFPYSSLRQMINSSAWPTGIQFRSKNPNEIDPGGWTEAVNGVTLDSNFWYIVGESHFTQIPTSIPLSDANPPRISFGWPHASAGRLRNGLLYVATHGSDDVRLNPANDGEVWAIQPYEALRTDETERTAPRIMGKVVIDGSGRLPWMDIHPSRPLLYWSDFDTGKVLQLRICAFSAWPSFEITPLGAMTLVAETGAPIQLTRVQGGHITPNNHILLVCDEPPDRDVSGIHLFDLQTGRRRWWVRFERNYVQNWTLGTLPGRQDEIQGIFVYDFGLDGLMHVYMVNKDLGRDNFSILNYDVIPALDRWKL